MAAGGLWEDRGQRGDFTSVGVIDSTMGAGIVEVFARHGIDVVAVEVDEAGIEHGRTVLGGSTARALAREKITQEEHDALHARVTYTTDLADLADCQLVVEAVPEHLDLKKELLGKVDAVVSPDAVLATNTVVAGHRDRRRDVEPQAGRRCTSSTRHRCSSSSRSSGR